MLVHGLLVESVDLRRLGGSAAGNDVLRDRFDGRPEAPGKKQLGPVARKGARDSTADRTPGSVDHCNLVLEHHRLSHYPMASLSRKTIQAMQEDAGRTMARLIL